MISRGSRWKLRTISPALLSLSVRCYTGPRKPDFPLRPPVAPGALGNGRPSVPQRDALKQFPGQRAATPQPSPPPLPLKASNSNLTPASIPGQRPAAPGGTGAGLASPDNNRALRANVDKLASINKLFGGGSASLGGQPSPTVGMRPAAAPTAGVTSAATMLSRLTAPPLPLPPGSLAVAAGSPRRPAFSPPTRPVSPPSPPVSSGPASAPHAGTAAASVGAAPSPASPPVNPIAGGLATAAPAATLSPSALPSSNKFNQCVLSPVENAARLLYSMLVILTCLICLFVTRGFNG
jgi:hypothetical protein